MNLHSFAGACQLRLSGGYCGCRFKGFKGFKEFKKFIRFKGSTFFLDGIRLAVECRHAYRQRLH